VLLIENKLLYRERADAALPEGYARLESAALLPTTVLRPPGQPDITIVAFGRMSGIAEQAAAALAAREEIAPELLFPLSVSPLDIEPYGESVSRTGRLLVIEEGAEGFDLAAEVIAGVRARFTEAARRCECGASPRTLRDPEFHRSGAHGSARSG
jgi:pyruvate dehydrogenase E1 component beta subunit